MHQIIKSEKNELSISIFVNVKEDTHKILRNEKGYDKRKMPKYSNEFGKLINEHIHLKA